MEENKNISSDEMFEYLGYAKIADNKYFSKDLSKTIEFYNCDYRKEIVVYPFNNISALELQAIYKKCKEIGLIKD